MVDDKELLKDKNVQNRAVKEYMKLIKPAASGYRVLGDVLIDGVRAQFRLDLSSISVKAVKIKNRVAVVLDTSNAKYDLYAGEFYLGSLGHFREEYLNNKFGDAADQYYKYVDSFQQFGGSFIKEINKVLEDAKKTGKFIPNRVRLDTVYGSEYGFKNEIPVVVFDFDNNALEYIHILSDNYFMKRSEKISSFGLLAYDSIQLMKGILDPQGRVHPWLWVVFQCTDSRGKKINVYKKGKFIN